MDILVRTWQDLAKILEILTEILQRYCQEFRDAIFPRKISLRGLR